MNCPDPPPHELKPSLPQLFSLQNMPSLKRAAPFLAKPLSQGSLHPLMVSSGCVALGDGSGGNEGQLTCLILGQF